MNLLHADTSGALSGYAGGLQRKQYLAHESIAAVCS